MSLRARLTRLTVDGGTAVTVKQVSRSLFNGSAMTEPSEINLISAVVWSITSWRDMPMRLSETESVMHQTSTCCSRAVRHGAPLTIERESSRRAVAYSTRLVTSVVQPTPIKLPSTSKA